MTTQAPSKKLFVLSATLALSGCGGPLDDRNTAIVENRPGPSFYVHEVLLKDGTRCVISTSGLPDGGTGIACDWGSKGALE